jgi:hypothetical protein
MAWRLRRLACVWLGVGNALSGRMRTQVAACLAIAIGSMAAPAVAQFQSLNLAAGLGGGFERGAGYALLDGRRSPVFIETAVRTWSDEEPTIALGGALRFELEQGIGVALVPRAELRRVGSSLELRPGIALPIFVAPRLMLGPEVSLGVRMGPKRGMGYFLMGTASAFVVGSDVPDHSTVLMLNLQLGVDLHL